MGAKTYEILAGPGRDFASFMWPMARGFKRVRLFGGEGREGKGIEEQEGGLFGALRTEYLYCTEYSTLVFYGSRQ